MTIPELEEQLRQRDAQIQEQAGRIRELEKEIQELKKLLVGKAKSKESKPPKEVTDYGVWDPRLLYGARTVEVAGRLVAFATGRGLADRIRRDC